ncbi:GFA family protein [Tahibacter amnicola]|uniref:Aldehyde-activating protein n=1 Tax=Tahibacter amnicola TaxID=2976241 RepID=A0ABY6BK49_9GAMM|nr:aldehyde-activating protein [Tahibacter amnicola]UXI70149.1 aldehyde-activating protein [Tahibacter amnicola]
MIRLNGGCHCGAIHTQVTLSAAPETYAPRACDCDFCTRHGAAWLSDPQGRCAFLIDSTDYLSRYRQGSQSAEFLLCARCGALVAVSYRDGNTLFAAVNRRAIDTRHAFEGEVTVSPQQLTPSAKTTRWREVWFRGVQLRILRDAPHDHTPPLKLLKT